MKQALESNGFSFPLKVTQPREKLPKFGDGQGPQTRHGRGTGQKSQLMKQEVRLQGSVDWTEGSSGQGSSMPGGIRLP